MVWRRGEAIARLEHLIHGDALNAWGFQALETLRGNVSVTCFHRFSNLKCQAGFGGQPKQFFPCRDMLLPASPVPDFAADIIATIENLPECHAAKLGDGEEGRRFHLHGQAPLVTPPLHFGGRLAVQGISRPGFRSQMLGAMRLQYLFNGSYGARLARTSRPAGR